jgi:uncharacterized protein
MNESWQETLVRVSRPVRYAAAAALGLLALFLFMQTLDLLMRGIGRAETYPTNTITVEGTGEATAIPDIATISYTVTERGATVAAAQEASTAKTDAALAFLKGAGIEEKDIKTTSYNVSPEYEYQNPCYVGDCPAYSNPRIIGYTVSQSIEVKVRETSKAGEVLQGLGNTGVQNIYGPNFTVDDTDAAREEARAEAIAEAREKAKNLAKDLGVSLGRVVSFYEATPGYPAYGYGGMMDMAMEAKNVAAPTLPVGESETQVTVNITYEIR